MEQIIVEGFFNIISALRAIMVLIIVQGVLFAFILAELTMIHKTLKDIAAKLEGG